MVVMSLVMMQGLKNSVEQLIDKLIFWKKNTLWNMNISREMEVFQINTVWKVFRIRSFFGSYFLHSDWILTRKIFHFFFEHFWRSVIKEKQSHNY